MVRLTGFDCFAGIGGFREAVFNVDFVGYCEVDKFAREAYANNFDVSNDICIKDLVEFLHSGNVVLPHVDFFSAGFPCQS